MLLCASTIHAQIVASFTPNITQGCSPLVVNYDASSTAAPADASLLYQWDFGNGNIEPFNATKVNVSAAYTVPGNYTVRLTVRDANGKYPDRTTQFSPITVFKNPTSDFITSGASTGCAPLTVNFLDKSLVGTRPISQWYWDFGDGTSSNAPNPSHVYAATGKYSVVLIVTDDRGCQSTKQIKDFVSIGNKPSPAFSSTNNTACTIPHTVNFTDETNLSGFTGPFEYLWNFGDGTTSTLKNPVKTYNAFGSYDVSLTVIDKSTNCPAVITKTRHVNLYNQTVSFTQNRVTGCSPLGVNFQSRVTPVIPGQTYQWTFGGAPNILSGPNTQSNIINPFWTFPNPGSYNVTLQTIGPHASCEKSYTNPTPVVVRDTPKNLTIGANPQGGCKVPTTINFTGNATDASSYRWTFQGGNPATSNVQNPGAVTYNAFGNYTVKFKAINSSGCADSITRTINIQPPNANFNANPRQGCTGSSIRFNDQSNSGDPIVNRVWNFGDGTTLGGNVTNPTHVYNTAGTYTVRLDITTATGCTDSEIKTAYIRIGEKPDATIAPFTPIVSCNPRTVTYVNASTGTADYYQWEPVPGYLTPPGPKQDLNFTYDVQPGNYGVILYAFKGGCSDTFRINYTITILPPKANFEFSVPPCGLDSIQFNDRSSGPGLVKWSWDFGTVGPNNTSSKQNPKFLFPGPGSYNVTLTVEHQNGCIDTETQRVVIPDYTAANISITPVNSSGCAPHPVLFSNTSTGSNSQKWTFGNGKPASYDNSPSIVYTEPGVYSVSITVTNNRGCTFTKTYKDLVKVYGPTVSFDLCPAKGCLPFTADFKDFSTSNSKIVSREWDLGNGVIKTGNDSSFFYTYNNVLPPPKRQKDGIPIKLTVTDQFGCKATTTSLIRPSSPKVDFTFRRLWLCDRDSIRFTGVNVDSTGVEPLTYSWLFSDGTTSSSRSPNRSFPKGTHTAQLTITDLNGCSSSITKVIDVNPKPPFASFCALDKNGVCADSIVATCPPQVVSFKNLSDKGRAGVRSWLWDFGDGSKSTLKDPARTYSQVGNFDVTLTLTDTLGCISDTVLPKIVRIKGPSADFNTSISTLCSGTTVTFTGIQLPPIEGALTYIWDFGDGSVANGQVVSHRYTTPGVKYPILIYSDASGRCTRSKQDTLFIKGLPLVRLKGDTAVCDGTPVTLDAGVSGANYLWNTGETTRSILAKTQGKFYVNITDPVSGCTSSDTTVITYIAKPRVTSIIYDNNNCGQAPKGKIVLTVAGPGAPYVYKWTNEFGLAIGTTDSIVFQEGGVFKANIKNSFGCQIDTSYTIINFPGNYELNLKSLTNIARCGDLGEVIVRAKGIPKTVNGITITVPIRVPFDSIIWLNDKGVRVFSSATFGNSYLPPLADMFGYDPMSNRADSIYFRLNGVPPGSYTLKIFEQEFDINGILLGGCPKQAGPYRVNPPPAPKFDLGPDKITCNTNITFVSNLTNAAITWSGPGLVTLNGTNAMTVNKTGKYILSAIDNVTNCPLKDSVNATIHPNPTANAGRDVDTCVNILTQLTATSDFGNKFNWFIRGNNTPVASSKNLLINFGTPISNRDYILQVLDSITGCRNNDTVRVNFTSNPIAAASVGKRLCLGDSVNVSGFVFEGSGGNIFSWTSIPMGFVSNASTFSVTPSVGSTQYRLVVTDVNGCVSNPAFTNVVATPLPVVNTVSDIEFCIGNDTTLAARATDGTGSFTYVWRSLTSGPDTIQNLLVKPDITTDYEVRVTDEENCEDIDSVTVIVNQLPIIRAFDTDTICYGASTTLFSDAFGGQGPYNYSWFTLNPDGFTSTNQNITVSPFFNTEYFVSSKDAKGCSSDTASVFVRINLIPSVYAGIDTAICPGATAYIKAKATGGGLASGSDTIIYTYEWNSIEDLTFNSSNSSFTISPLATTQYMVKATDGLCESPLDIVRVTVNPKPVALVVPKDQVVCKGDLATAVASGALGGRYIWYGADRFITLDSVVNIVASVDTSIWVKIIDKNGCEDIDSAFVRTFTTPALNLIQHICLNPSETFVIKGRPTTFEIPNASYNWSLKGVSLPITISSVADSNLTVLASDTGIYKVVYGLGNCIVSDSVGVTLNPTVEAGADQTICINDSANQVATSLNEVSYTWINPSNVTLGNDSSLTLLISQDTLLKVIVEDKFNCAAKDSAFVRAFTTPPVDLPAHICLNPSENFVIKGKPKMFEIPNATYSWSFNNLSLVPTVSLVADSNLTILASNLGTYKLVYGLGKCIVSDSVGVSLNPNVEAGLNQTICINDSATQIATSLNEVSYQWINPSNVTLGNDSSLTLLISQDTLLKVIVEDKFKCIAKDSAFIDAYKVPDVSLTTLNCLDSNGTVTLKGRPRLYEIPNATYTWYYKNVPQIRLNPLTDSNFVVSATDSGKYKVRYGLDKCFVSDSAYVRINPTLAVTPEKVICINDTVVHRAKSPNSVSYEWFNSAGLVLSTLDSIKIKVTQDSLLFVRIKDRYQCIVKDTAIVKAFTTPALDLLPRVCLNPSDNFEIKGKPKMFEIPNATYNWTYNNVALPTTISPIADSNLTIFASNLGTYKLVYGLGNCFVTDSVGATLNPLVDAGPNQTICINDSATQVATSNNDVRYTWINPSNDTLGINKSLTLLILQDTLLNVIVEDKFKCVAKDATLISAYKAPDINLTTLNCLDSNSVVILKGRPLLYEIPNATYTWYHKNMQLIGLNPLIDSNLVVSAADSGQYVVRYGLDKCFVNDTAYVRLKPKVKLLADTVVCINDSTLQLAASNNLVFYIWKNLLQDTLGTGDSILIKIPSDTTIFVVASDQYGCFATDTVKVKTYRKPTILIPDAFCYNPLTSFTLNAGPGNTKIPTNTGLFKWTKNGAPVSGLNSPLTDSIYIATDTGTYVVNYGLGGCIVKDTSIITLSPLVDAGPDVTICFATSTLLEAKIKNGTGTPGFVYNWDFNLDLSDTNTTKTKATPDSTLGIGTYKYIINVIDTVGCNHKDSILVNVVKPTDLQIVNPISCIGDTITLKAVPSNITASLTYQWYEGSKKLNEISDQLLVDKVGTYKVVYKEGFCADSTVKYVPFNPKPVPDNIPSYIFCKDTTRLDSSSVLMDAGPAAYYLWDKGDTTRRVKVDEKGTYYFKIFNHYNCFVKDSILVFDECPPRLFVADAFTPNGDNRNELFKVYYAYVKNFKMWIFNRWGEVIYYSEDQNSGWDGFYRNDEIPAGTYPWLIQYDSAYDKFGTNIKKNGRVTLIR